MFPSVCFPQKAKPLTRFWGLNWVQMTEKELGLNITQEQIDELKAHAEDINYDVAKERERQVLSLIHISARRLDKKKEVFSQVKKYLRQEQYVKKMFVIEKEEQEQIVLKQGASY